MRTNTSLYAAAVGLALVTALLPFYVELAVGIIDPPGGSLIPLELGVLAIGMIGALIARFEPLGMARALVAMAVSQALVALISLMVEPSHPASPPLEVLGVHAVFVVLFLASAMLFRKAALQPLSNGTARAR